MKPVRALGQRMRMAGVIVATGCILGACGPEVGSRPEAVDDRDTVAEPGSSPLAVHWSCERHVFALESDLWPTTWSDDGNMYAAWGDGWGFALDTSTHSKKSHGISRLDGTGVSDLRGFDLHYGPDGERRGKISSMVSVNGVLYLLLNHQDDTGTLSLRIGVDRGRTIGDPLWSASEVDIGGFVQAGRDNEAADGFVYAIQDGGRLGDPNDIFLYRAPEREIGAKSAWTTFTGVSKRGPTWGRAFPANPDREPILSLPGADAMQVTWFEGLNRWIGFLNTGHDIADFRVLEAENPWGPWRLISDHESDGWCEWEGTSGWTDIRKIVAPAWIGDNGERFVLFASAPDGSLEWDALVAVEGALLGTFQSSPDL